VQQLDDGIFILQERVNLAEAVVQLCVRHLTVVKHLVDGLDQSFLVRQTDAFEVFDVQAHDLVHGLDVLEP
jgi:hypothetical protein